MMGWRTVWSMVGRWLVYVPTPDGGEMQLSFPSAMKAEAHKIGAAKDLLDALEELYAIVQGECPRLLDEDSGANPHTEMCIIEAIAKARGEA